MGSLFAGIGGFDEGFRRTGFHTLWQVEIEPFPQAVLRTHFPEADSQRVPTRKRRRDGDGR